MSSNAFWLFMLVGWLFYGVWVHQMIFQMAFTDVYSQELRSK